MPSLSENLSEAANLAEKLSGSLRAQAVWPQAFDNGNSCTLMCHTVWPHAKPKNITRAYLKRSDGVEFPITTEQYLGLVTPMKQAPEAPQKKIRSM